MNARLRSASTSGDRYARHRAIPGFSQAALQASRFAVIGAGAIGNEVVKNLCLLGVGGIDVYDLDTVERHNLTRSVLLREADIGSSKAERVASHARALDPAVDVVARPGDLHDTFGVSDARGYRAVIGALDNFEARLRVNQVCWLAGTDWINAAIDSRHASVESFPFGSADGVPACYECTLPLSVYRRIAERRSCGGLQRAAARQRVVPTTAITASFAGAQAVNRALAPGRAAQRWLLDTHGGAGVASLAPAPDCPGCGDLPRRAALLRLPTAAADALATAAHRAGADILRLAEPLVWRCRCRTCGPTEHTHAVELQPARRVPDTILRCPRCGTDAVDVEIRDTLDPDELRERFAEAATVAAPPVRSRYAIGAGTCFELPVAEPAEGDAA